MNAFTQLARSTSTRNKIMTGFAVVLITSGFSAWLSLNSLSAISERTDKVQQVLQSNTQLLEARIQEKNFFLRRDPAYAVQAQELIGGVLKDLQAVREQFVDPRSIELVTQAEQAGEQYRLALSSFVQERGKSMAAQASMETEGQKVLATVEQILDQQLERYQQASFVLDEGVRATLSSQLRTAESLTREVLHARRDEKNLVITRDRTHAQSLLARMDGLRGELEQLAAQAQQGEARSQLEEATEALQRYEGHVQEMLAAMQLVDDAEKRMTEQARSTLEFSRQTVQQQQTKLDEEEAAIRNTLVISTLIVLVLGICFTFLISHLIVQPLKVAVSHARRIADGDLSRNVDVEGSDEPAQLSAALAVMTSNLRELLERISDGTQQLASAAEELSAVTEQASAGINQQRLETDQVATAINEMSATVQDVAHNAEAAANAADAADGDAREGQAVVNQTVERIRDLAESIERSSEVIERLKNDSGNISAILVVIRGISEQTNLLALNAAIEAARAGEAGRGFAVVADEVRGLARRTQESTGEIENLIQTLQQGAEEGVRNIGHNCALAEQSVSAATQAGQALGRITAAVSTIQQMNQQIATAAEEQTAVSEDINRSVSSIRDVSEQSAAAAEETSASSMELARLGGDLQALVARFRLS